MGEIRYFEEKIRNEKNIKKIFPTSSFKPRLRKKGILTNFKRETKKNNRAIVSVRRRKRNNVFKITRYPNSLDRQISISMNEQKCYKRLIVRP